MGIPVVIKPSGGLPVTVATNGFGLPMTVATNGFGLAVTQAPAGGGGLAVTGITFGPTIALSAASVLETAAVNTVVGTLSVTAGTTGSPVFALVDSAGGKFNISGTSLRTNALLDYETATFHSITVSVTGVTPTVANATFIIFVQDVAEPVILLTGTTVNENATAGTNIGVLSIANTFTGTPVYTLVDSASGKVAISGANLNVLGAIDYETTPTFNITVSVSGITPAAANKVFTVVVLDVVETGATWNPSDKSTLISLSAGNLTATGQGGSLSGARNIRATVSKTTGKYFCKFTIVSSASSTGAIGICNASTDLKSGGPPGNQNAPAHGCCFTDSGYIIYDNGTFGGFTYGPIYTSTVGDVISMAVDLTAKRIWFRKNALDWNNNVSADPATGTGGYDISNAIQGDAFFPAASVYTETPGLGALSVDFSGTGAPSGFSAWGGGALGTTKNIVTDYAAVGDAQWAQTTLSITTNVLTSATPIWASGDVGKSIVVGQCGGGAGEPQGGTPLRTTIAAFTSATQITLAANCVSPLSSEPNVIVAWGTNNGKMLPPNGADDADGPFARFRNDFQGQAVTLTIPAGTYLISNGNFGGLFNGIRNITVNATGATLAGGLFQIQADAQYGATGHTARTASVTAGSSFVTLSTPSQVSRFVVGNYAMMAGFGLQYGGYPTNHQRFEYLLITAIDSDSGSPTYGRITFSTSLVNSYLSTWPLYDAGGPNYGGPATLYAMDPDFNHTCVVNNLTVAHHCQWAVAGLNVTLNNCVFKGLYGPYPTMGRSIAFTNCLGTECHMEVDKLVTAFTMTGCTWGGIGCQSTSTTLFTLDNTDITYTLLGTPYKAVIRNGCAIGTLQPGSNYGFANELDVRDSVVSNFGSVTYHGSGYEIRSGDFSGDGIQSDFTMAGGIITIPSSFYGYGIIQQWAVTGGKLYFVDANVGTIGAFAITDVTQDASNVRVYTNWSGGFPSRSYPAGLGLNMLTHSAPDCTFVNVTGCNEALMLSTFPAHTPLYSRFFRSFGSATSVTTGYWQLYGRVKSVIVTVVTPYVGATATVRATLTFGNATVRMSDFVDVVWNPVINLKAGGTRTFSAPTAGGSWTGTIDASDVLTGMPSAQWATSNFRVVIDAFVAGTGPVFTVEVITDQG